MLTMTKRELVEHFAFILPPLLKTAMQSGCSQEAAVELLCVMAKVLSPNAAADIQYETLHAESTAC